MAKDKKKDKKKKDKKSKDDGLSTVPSDASLAHTIYQTHRLCYQHTKTRVQCSAGGKCLKDTQKMVP